MNPIYLFVARDPKTFAVFEVCGPCLVTVDYDGIKEANTRALRREASAFALPQCLAQAEWSPIGKEGENADLGFLTFRGERFTVSAQKVFG